MKYIYVIIFSIIFMSLGCKRELSEYNPSGTTADVIWTTPKGFLTCVNGAYSYIPLLFGNDENELFLSEGGTDLWYNENKASYDVDIMRYLNFTSSSNSVKSVWTNLYAAINLCNAGIGRIDNVDWSASPSDRNLRLSELKFLRGFYYMNVVETWGNCILDTLETSSSSHTAVRSSVDSFYNLITRDLHFAANFLPSEVSSSYQYGRATKAAAYGFLARAYLAWAYHDNSQSYFQMAKNMADSVIDQRSSFGLRLYSSFDSLWLPANRYPSTVNTEAMFVAPFSTTSSLNVNGNADRTHMWFLTNYSGYSGTSVPGLSISLLYGNDQKNRRFMPTRGLVDLYDDTMDSRFNGTFQQLWLCNKAHTWTSSEVSTWGKNANIIGHVMNVGDTAMWITKNRVSDKASRPYVVIDRDTSYNSDGTINYADRYLVLKKYLDPLTRTGLTSYAGYLNVIIMRLAEMYLIAAEADFQMGNSSGAAAYINVLRSRAAIKYPEDFTNAMQVKASDITLDFILDERARELCGEYQRWFDLKRTGTFAERLSKYNPDVTAYQSYYSLRPIPLSELQALTNAEEFGQNTGY